MLPPDIGVCVLPISSYFSLEVRFYNTAKTVGCLDAIAGTALPIFPSFLSSPCTSIYRVPSCAPLARKYIYSFLKYSFLLVLPPLKLARCWVRGARQEGCGSGSFWELHLHREQQHLHRVTVVRLPEEPRAIPLQCKSRRKAGCSAFPTSWLRLSQPPVTSAVTAEGLFVVLQPADLRVKNGVSRSSAGIPLPSNSLHCATGYL